MSILIPGMKMPEACEDCPLYSKNSSKCLAVNPPRFFDPHDLAWREPKPGDELGYKPSWCPLIELTPHGYQEAEAEGRLLILPCKVGDTVWSAEPFKDGKPRKGSIVQINLNASGFCGFWASFDSEPIAAEFISEDIGKTVFLTREEAEAALRGGADR